MQYVDTGKDRPGASDALFWKQYLSEEEGEPVFGFDATERTQATDTPPATKDRPAADPTTPA